MAGNLSLEALREAVDRGEIDTVVAAMVDMQGRLQGKRFHARHFVDGGWHETHCCNYLLATDLEMTTVPGYKVTGWEKGYGDYMLKPDLATLRRIPWLPATALVLCDVLDHRGAGEIAHSPRAILRRQIGRAAALGLHPMMASELEFFLFEPGYDALRDGNYQNLLPLSRYNIDYSVFGTTKEEGVMRAIRNGLHGAGVTVENSKGEAEAGQEEINVRYGPALEAADTHAIVKNAVKEIAHAHGHAATFMAKYHHDRTGSSCHIHQSLARADGSPAFHDPAAPHTMSALMRHYVAGLLAHAEATTLFLAPYVNSYKRFVVGMFAPTTAGWSLDNRTAGFRLVGEATRGVRIECRIPGADVNPYLAMAAQLAAGLDGIARRLELEPPVGGDLYRAAGQRHIPRTLGAAAAAARSSAMLAEAFGEEVVDHYHRAAQWEIEEQNRVVTDWEVRRGFERG
ncbi:MAG: glutamine synthetase [Rhodobacteraceae bacterium]|nr:glutamine synthetase [Paracoccaceae bacterium]